MCRQNSAPGDQPIAGRRAGQVGAAQPRWRIGTAIGLAPECSIAFDALDRQQLAVFGQIAQRRQAAQADTVANKEIGRPQQQLKARAVTGEGAARAARAANGAALGESMGTALEFGTRNEVVAVLSRSTRRAAPGL